LVGIHAFDSRLYLDMSNMEYKLIFSYKVILINTSLYHQYDVDSSPAL